MQMVGSREAKHLVLRLLRSWEIGVIHLVVGMYVKVRCARVSLSWFQQE